MAVAPNHEYLGKQCKVCESGKTVETLDNNEWWTRCNDCGHLQFCYTPMPHQLRFHQDPTKYKLYAGGYGSAKTSTCGAEFISLALATPNGEGLVGAHTKPQLDRTAKKQIIDMLPSELIHDYNKVENVIVLTNGYQILFRSFDEEQKLRSLNLCHVWIEEANGTAYSIFTQLETRLRHHATDNHRIIMSTNPDGNWIKTEILLKADRIYGAKERYHRNLKDRNPNISVHIARTEMNVYLPPNYIEDISVGKPAYWIDRYLNGSFRQAEGLVYPNFEDCITDEITYDEVVHNIQRKGWRVIGGSDFGLRHPTTLMLAAIDPDEGTVYVYSEYYRNKLQIAVHAENMKRNMRHIPTGLLWKLMGDPAGAKRSQTDQKSIFNHYSEHGIYFHKANNRIEAGISKVFSYLESGRLKILSHLEYTIQEAKTYMYKPSELGEDLDEIPLDKDNHLMDTLRYIINELPDDLTKLSTGTFGMDDVVGDLKNTHANSLPYELTENEHMSYVDSDAWMNY